MVDLSCYFRIHNRLDVDLQLDDTSQIHYGHWEKKPNDGLVPAFSVSEEFQIKDPPSRSQVLTFVEMPVS